MAKKAITIKRSAATVKTIKAKTDGAPAPAAPIAVAGGTPAPDAPAAAVQVNTVADGKKGNPYTWAAIVGIIATICYIIIITLQVLEYTYYDQPPGAFPIFVPSAVPAATSAPAVSNEKTSEEPEKAATEEAPAKDAGGDEEAVDLDAVEV